MRCLVLAMTLTLAAASAGCADVAPWQRAKLAHPSMTDTRESPGRAHMTAVQEGAIGGTVGAASGCGCN
ncbi:MAG: DUF4266 domain-containing protein [Myxococcales bacterium]|nr:DUF4266 domain-containing protein [Myxococcales bacterium]